MARVEPMAGKGSARSRARSKEPGKARVRGGPEPPPETLGEALARARQHGRAAAAEALAMVRALIDAASLVASGRPSEASRLLSPLAKLLEALGDDLGHVADDGSSQILDSIARAIDEEIALWEERARDDTEARTVLRAFLGLREILWEFGFRHSGGAEGADSEEPPRPSSSASRRTAAKSRGARIQRVPIQG
jgi:hypothetical protein